MLKPYWTRRIASKTTAQLEKTIAFWEYQMAHPTIAFDLDRGIAREQHPISVRAGKLRVAREIPAQRRAHSTEGK